VLFAAVAVQRNAACELCGVALSFIEAQGITAVIKPLLFNGLNRTIFRLSKKQHMATVLV
jgi:hypothetical protein